MTGCAILTRELPPVRIGRVTVRAKCVRHWLVKVAVAMAAEAGDIRVSAAQRKGCAAVVEVVLQPDALPSRSVVATLAGPLKRAVMRILVAVAARVERHTPELSDGAPVLLHAMVAFTARNALMQASQGETSQAMIEHRHRFPPLDTMASRAISSKLTPMLVQVARDARGGKAKPCGPQVSNANRRSRVRRYVLWSVASAASHAGVLAFQRIPGLPMIELLYGSGPVNDIRVRTDVFGMAARAILESLPIVNHAGVETAVAGQAVANLRMASQALQPRRSSAEYMTGGAVLRPTQSRMCLREWSR